MSGAGTLQASQGNKESSVTVYTLSVMIIGIILIFVGGLMTYIYFTEIIRPNYDSYYQQYVGSSFPRIAGILILMAGLTLFWGASIYLVHVNWTKKSDETNSTGTQYKVARYYFEDSQVPRGSPVPTQATSAVRFYHDDAHNRPQSTLNRENYIV